MTDNIGYAIGNNKWFLGQVPPAQNQHVKSPVWTDTHGDRVKVRIPGMHPMSSPDEENEVNDQELPWAIVAKPTTHGNRNAQQTGIWGGEWVIGFFMDEDCQIPVITQVLGNNLNENTDTKFSDGNTKGKRIDRYNSGREPNPAEITGGSKPDSQAKPSATELNKGKKEVYSSPTNENGVSLGLKLESWDGGRKTISEKDYNTVIESKQSTTTPTVKLNAAKAAVNSGVISRKQYQRTVSKLTRESEAKKIPSFDIGGARE
tara:strand:+ start:7790 stop:8572 length:783 start_codon:yes stop_codon:yes gene_type:complete